MGVLIICGTDVVADNPQPGPGTVTPFTMAVLLVYTGYPDAWGAAEPTLVHDAALHWPAEVATPFCSCAPTAALLQVQTPPVGKFGAFKLKA